MSTVVCIVPSITFVRRSSCGSGLFLMILAWSWDPRKGTLKALAQYVILDCFLLPFCQKKFWKRSLPVLILPVHKASQLRLQSDWTAQSLDLNLIECLWDIRQRVRSYPLTLVSSPPNCKTKMPINTLLNLGDNLPVRLEAVIALNLIVCKLHFTIFSTIQKKMCPYNTRKSWMTLNDL